MGRSTTPKYRVEVVPADASLRLTPSAWRVGKDRQIPGNGKPTLSNLTNYINALEASTLPGGSNAHLGFMPIAEARIVDQFTGQLMAHWRKATTK